MTDGPPLHLPDRLGDSRLELRPPRSSDVDRIAAICSDPVIGRFTRVPSPYRREDAVSFVTFATEQLRTGEGVHLVVEEDGVVVGAVGAGIDAQDEVARIGYWTAPEARGRGVTTDAARLLCRWLVETVGVARLELDAAATNGASNGVAAALGFTREGTRRAAMLLPATHDLPATRVDAHVWGCLADELV